MNKKEILTLIATGLAVLLISGFSSFAIVASSGGSDDPETDTSISDDSLKVGNYTLHYGKYVGTSTEYDPDEDETITSEVTIVLKKDGEMVMGSTPKTYEIDGTRLKVDGSSIINVTNDDQFTLEAGAGIDFKYKEN